jgi:lipoprotein-anchoring transpeptidase ErfK/SrfK
VIGEVRSVIAGTTTPWQTSHAAMIWAIKSRANPGVNPWVPGEGTRIVPAVHPRCPRRVVLNLAEMRLYYYPKAVPGERRKVITHPLGIGREGWNTPLGKTEVVRKVANPSWYPPESIRKEHAAEGDILPEVVPGPNNPLGQFALYLGFKGYLIHGTDKSYGIGMRVSHGCMRLPEDIARCSRVRHTRPRHRSALQGRLARRATRLGSPAARGAGGGLLRHQPDASGTGHRGQIGDADGVVEWHKVLLVASDPRGMPVSVRQGRVPRSRLPAGLPALATLGSPVQARRVRLRTRPQSTRLGRSHRTRWPLQGRYRPIRDDASQGPGLSGRRLPSPGERWALAARLQTLAPRSRHSPSGWRLPGHRGSLYRQGRGGSAPQTVTSYFQIETQLLAPPHGRRPDEKPRNPWIAGLYQLPSSSRYLRIDRLNMRSMPSPTSLQHATPSFAALPPGQPWSWRRSRSLEPAAPRS